MTRSMTIHKRRAVGWRALITASLILGACAAASLGGCGGAQSGAVALRPAAGDAAQTEMGAAAENPTDPAATAPAQPDTALMALLQRQLTLELARLEVEKATAAYWPPFIDGMYSPNPYAVNSLQARWIDDPDGKGPAPPQGLELRWVEALAGDYDQNGEVNVGDLTPLAQHWGATVDYVQVGTGDEAALLPKGDPEDDGGASPPAAGSGAYNWRLARIDGNRDGELSIADVTEIARHWGERLHGYTLWREWDFGEGPNEDKVANIRKSELGPVDPDRPVIYNHEVIRDEDHHQTPLVGDEYPYRCIWPWMINGDYSVIGDDWTGAHRYKPGHSNLAKVEYEPARLPVEVTAPIPLNPSAEFYDAPMDRLARGPYCMAVPGRGIRLLGLWPHDPDDHSYKAPLNPLIIGIGQDGAVQWIKQVSDPRYMDLVSMAADTAGNTYFTCCACYDTYFYSYTTDNYLLKLDPEGDVEWQVNLRFFVNQNALLGYVPLCLLVSDAELRLISEVGRSHGIGGLMVQAMSAWGGLLWERCWLLDSETQDNVDLDLLAAGVDASGAVVACGWWEDYAASDVSIRLFLTRFTPEGEMSWFNVYNLPDEAQVTGCAVAPTGEAYLALDEVQGEPDYAVIKFNANGFPGWSWVIPNERRWPWYYKLRLAAAADGTLAVGTSLGLPTENAPMFDYTRAAVLLFEPEGGLRQAYHQDLWAEMPGYDWGDSFLWELVYDSASDCFIVLSDESEQFVAWSFFDPPLEEYGPVTIERLPLLVEREHETAFEPSTLELVDLSGTTLEDDPQTLLWMTLPVPSAPE